VRDLVDKEGKERRKKIKREKKLEQNEVVNKKDVGKIMKKERGGRINQNRTK
jgi:hypothetical protein